MKEWIKCSERMPNKEEYVLIFSYWGSFAVAERWDRELLIDAHGEARFIDYEGKAYIARFWMPLPIPPEAA